MSITHPRASRARRRPSASSGRTSPSRPAHSASSAVPRLAPHQMSQASGSEPATGQGAVEHDHEVVADPRGDLLGEPASGGDRERLADAVQHQPVAGREQRDRADAGDARRSSKLSTRRGPGSRSHDADGAVVERRVAPDQEAATSSDSRCEHLLVTRPRGALVPVRDGRAVVASGVRSRGGSGTSTRR